MLLTAPKAIKSVLPIVPIKDFRHGIHKRLKLVFSCREVQFCAPAESLFDYLILGNGYNCLILIYRRIQRAIREATN